MFLNSGDIFFNNFVLKLNFNSLKNKEVVLEILL